MVPGRFSLSVVAVISTLLWTASFVDSAPTRRRINIDRIQSIANEVRSKTEDASLLDWNSELSTSAYAKATDRCISGAPFLPEENQSTSERVIDAENPEGNPTEEVVSSIYSWAAAQDENYRRLVAPSTAFFGCGVVSCPAGAVIPDQEEYLIVICQYD